MCVSCVPVCNLVLSGPAHCGAAEGNRADTLAHVKSWGLAGRKRADVVRRVVDVIGLRGYLFRSQKPLWCVSCAPARGPLNSWRAHRGLSLIHI